MPFQTADDLCGLAARQDPLLAEARDAGARIVACSDRAVRWLFAAAGAALPANAAVFNLRERAAEEVLRSLVPPERLADALAAAGAAQPPADPEVCDWEPWFPVIDYDRCTSCGKCLSFCLFGVYSRGEDGRIAAARPANCKTHCPACARICPAGAIIFPKHPTGPINGGPAEPFAADAAAAADLEAALAGDVYRKLRRRGQAKEPSTDHGPGG